MLGPRPRGSPGAALDVATALFVGTLVVAVAAVAGPLAPDVADAGHDAAVARVLGLEPEAWRSLDVCVGNAFELIPIGTRAARAALASDLATGIAAAVLYALVRRLLTASAPTRGLGSVVAAIVTVTAAFSGPWQVELGCVGGSGLGAALVLAPLALSLGAPGNDAASGAPRAWSAAWSARTASLVLGLAFGYEPLVGVCALAACAAGLAADAGLRASLLRPASRRGPALVAAFAAGLVPWGLAVARSRLAGVPLAHALASSWSGERGAGRAESIVELARLHIGALLGVTSLAGVVLVALVPKARGVAAGFAALVAAGALAAALGAPLGPTRFGAPILAALGAAIGLAAPALQAVVRAVASARVPHARASAAMVVVLESAIAAGAVDDAVARAERGDRARAAEAAGRWDDVAWGALPRDSIVLLKDARVSLRSRAARAQGRLRDDIVVLDLDSPSGVWRTALLREPALMPIERDVALTGLPSESSLSALAGRRPLFVVFEPTWGAPVARHVVPFALLDRFETEPRGAADRARALDALAPTLDALSHRIADDPDLCDVSVRLFRARAAALESSATTASDHALVARAAADAARLAAAHAY
jgi:hypothetical protein